MEAGVELIELDQPSNDVRPYVLYCTIGFSAGASLFGFFRCALTYNIGQKDFFRARNILDGKAVCSILCIFRKVVEG